jgi:NAD kinase
MDRKVVLVTRQTRLEALVARFNTRDQARFYVESLGQDFSDYESEQHAHDVSKAVVIATLQRHGRWQSIDRGYLTNFVFGPDDVVVAHGQDGLVANTVKYLHGQPLVGVNPDPARYDGVLLPFRAADLAAVLPEVLADRRPTKMVTMAEARLSDGQSMLAVNDIFLGPHSHTSARYRIELDGRQETQSSSGVIVSTGLGSTGWMSSIVAGSLGIGAAWSHAARADSYKPLAWDAGKLLFAVREPFPSRTTGVGLVYGECDRQHPLTMTSLMAEGGVIFSDGIESDYIGFGAGMTAVVAPAARAGKLIV